MVAPTMDAETQKRWDAWAKRVAEREARTAIRAIVDQYEPRILELEAEVARLKGQQRTVEEWPLRSIQGGKR